MAAGGSAGPAPALAVARSGTAVTPPARGTEAAPSPRQQPGTCVPTPRRGSDPRLSLPRVRGFALAPLQCQAPRGVPAKGGRPAVEGLIPRARESSRFPVTGGCNRSRLDGCLVGLQGKACRGSGLGAQGLSSPPPPFQRRPVRPGVTCMPSSLRPPHSRAPPSWGPHVLSPRSPLARRWPALRVLGAGCSDLAMSGRPSAPHLPRSFPPVGTRSPRGKMATEPGPCRSLA